MSDIADKLPEETRISVISDGEDSENEQYDEEEQTFLERVRDLIDALKTANGFKDHPGLESFTNVILMIERKEEDQRSSLEDGVKRVFLNFYLDNRELLVKGKTEFLCKGKHMISFGKSGKAHIPLGEIYISLTENDPEIIDTVDGCIYFVLQHICPDDDLDEILDICREFEPEESSGGNFLDMIGTIVGRVSSKLGDKDPSGLEGEDGELNTDEIGNVVKDLIGDDVIQGSMKDMMASITNDDFDVNSVFSNLMNVGNKKK